MMLETRKLSELIPADYNPRKALKPGDPTYEKLKRSIEEFGCVLPLIYNTRSNTLIGGHQRLTVLKDLGIEDILAVTVDFDEAREKALNIALNKIEGAWDEEKLLSLISEIGESVSLTGFDEKEIEGLIASLYENKEVKDDGFDLDAALKEPSFVKPGDLWTVGRHKLYCGDVDGLDSLIGSTPINLLISEWDKNFSKAVPHIADGASVYLFHHDEDGLAAREAFKDLHFSGVCVYACKSVADSENYGNAHQPILFGFKKGKRHHWYAGRKETTVWFQEDPEKRAHPRSLRLVGYPIQNSTAENGTVLEFCSDAGECLIASEALNRNCLTFVSSPLIASAILRRYVAYTGDSAGVACERGSYLELQGGTHGD